MKKDKINWFVIRLILIFVFIFVSCGPRPEVEEPASYPQNSVTDIAYLVLEKNGQPYIMASGSLANKEQGLFRTAKHFTDEFRPLGTDSCKVFFNGKVYTAELARVPSSRDAAVIRISSPFDPEDFPEPSPIAGKQPELGDTVRIKGAHPHAYWVREANKSEGFPDNVVEIFEKYYGVIMKDPTMETQVVLDDLGGKVVKPDPESVRKNPFFSDEMKEGMLEFENDKYMKVLMRRDHKFSFGGLSGGLAVNDRGEVIGVITAQDIYRFEFDKNGLFVDPNSGHVAAVVEKQLFDTIYITPIDSIADIEEYMRNLK